MSLNVGIAKINKQHKVLIYLINAINRTVKNIHSISQATTDLVSLIDYTHEHFNYDEDLFAGHGYPETQQHKLTHITLLGQLDDYKQQLQSGEKIDSGIFNAMVKAAYTPFGSGLCGIFAKKRGKLKWF